MSARTSAVRAERSVEERSGSTGGSRHEPEPLAADRNTPALRLVPPRLTGARRVPFFLLLSGLLAGGVAVLLFLNSTTTTNSFRERRLEEKTAKLAAQKDELSREVATLQAPGALATAARQLGMVNGAGAAFLVPDANGAYRIVGNATPATAPPPPPPPSTPAPTPSAPKPSPPPQSNPSSPAEPSRTPEHARQPTPSPAPPALPGGQQ